MSSGPVVTTGKVLFSSPPADGNYARQEVPWADPDASTKNNYTVELNEIVVENLRGKEESTTLDTVGFQLFHRPSRFKTLSEVEENLKTEYSSECIDVVKELTGAKEVIIFAQCMPSGTLCRRVFSDCLASTDIRRRQLGDKTAVQPDKEVHVDFSSQWARQLVNIKFPTSDGTPQHRRCRIFSVWRPIENPAFDSPLGLCDQRSVKYDEDTFPVGFGYAELPATESLAIKYNVNYRWKYFYGIMPEEVLLIKL